VDNTLEEKEFEEISSTGCGPNNFSWPWCLKPLVIRVSSKQIMVSLKNRSAQTPALGFGAICVPAQRAKFNTFVPVSKASPAEDSHYQRNHPICEKLKR
jgi:hypothetical protein